MGLDIRHQVLRVALSVKVNGKRRRLSLHRARPPRTCVKLSMKITVTTSRVGAYPHTQKSGLRRLTGAYPHTKISVAQSYPDPYVFGILNQLEKSPTFCRTNFPKLLVFRSPFVTIESSRPPAWQAHKTHPHAHSSAPKPGRRAPRGIVSQFLLLV